MGGNKKKNKKSRNDPEGQSIQELEDGVSALSRDQSNVNLTIPRSVNVIRKQEMVPLNGNIITAASKDGNSEFRVPQDSYAFILLSRFYEVPLYFGLFVWAVQVITLSLFFADQVNFGGERNTFNIPGNVETSVRVSQAIAIIISTVFAGASLGDLLTSIELLFIIKIDKTQNHVDARFYHRLWLQALLRFFQGAIGILVTTLLIVQSDTVFDLILNFTAVTFISELDEVAFELSDRKYFGTILKAKAEEVEYNRLPPGYKVKRNPTPLGLPIHYWRFIAVTIVALGMFASYILILVQQLNGFYLCKELLVEFGDTIFPDLGAYNGIYEMLDDTFSDKQRVVYRQNMGTDYDGRMGYCDKENAWTLYTGDNSCDFLARSTDTNTFEIEETSDLQWFDKFGKPIEYNKFSCSLYNEQEFIFFEEDEVEEDDEDDTSGRNNTCTQIVFDISQLTDSEALQLSYNQIFNLIPDVTSHGQAVYRARIQQPTTMGFGTFLSNWFDCDNYEFRDDFVPSNDYDADRDSFCQDFDLNYYVCHTWFDPQAGALDKTNIFLSYGWGSFWETDSFGCCDGVCPASEDSRTTAPVSRPWFPWVKRNVTAGTGAETDDDRYDFGDDFPFLNWFELLGSEGTEAYEPSNKEDDGPCAGLSAYLIFNGRRWMHVVSDFNDICDENFHAGHFLSGADSNYTVTHVSEAIEAGSPKSGTPVDLTWFLADPKKPAYPTPDTTRRIDDPMTCPSKIAWGDVLAPGSQFPSYLFRLDDIQILDFTGLFMSGTIPTEIGLMSALTYLRLESNAFTGTIPSEIGMLTELTYLNLNQNKFSSEIPTEMANLKKMRHLHLYETEVVGRLQIDTFKAMPALESLTLGGSRVFEFQIAVDIGPLPTEIGDLTALTSLAIAYSDYTGTIPTEIGRLTSLEILAIKDNRKLYGELPTQIGQLTNLRLLDFTDSLLTGTLPSEIGYLSDLEIFSVLDCFLTGYIPTEMGDLQKLRHVDLEGNMFNGSLPEGLCDSEVLFTLQSDCRSLPGCGSKYMFDDFCF